MCEDNIQEYKNGYVIEKALKHNYITNKYATAFEYALCTEYLERLSFEMSKESTRKIKEFIEKNFPRTESCFFKTKLICEKKLLTLN